LVTAFFAAEIIGYAVLAEPHGLPFWHKNVTDRILDEDVLRPNRSVPFRLGCGVGFFARRPGPDEAPSEIEQHTQYQ
jgi:hypothetical protein